MGTVRSRLVFALLAAASPSIAFTLWLLEAARPSPVLAALGMLLTVAAPIAVGYWLSRRVLEPVEDLRRAADAFIAGSPGVRAPADGVPPIERLARQFNRILDESYLQVARADEQQAFLDAVIRQMPEGLIILDSEGAITRVNAAAEALLGVSSDRLVGRPILSALLNYSLDVEVRRVLETGASVSVDVQMPEGPSLRAAVGPLEIQGRPAGALLIVQDVSAIRRVDAMRRDFVANVSHELRTPLAAIRAMVETLSLRAARRPELVVEYGPRIVTECERLDLLVHDLLLLAETESGALHMEPETIQPLEAAETVVSLVESALPDGRTRIVLDDFCPDTVRADRKALEQCLRNLVENALKYAGGGRVALGSRRELEQVVLWVSDDGPGIPSESLPRIFERFYRVESARERPGGARGGSGLGLAIVKHLVAAQGGRVWAESQLGSGSTFYIALPAAEDAPAPPLVGAPEA